MRNTSIVLCSFIALPFLTAAQSNFEYSEFKNTQGREMEVRIYKYRNVQCTNELIDQFKVPVRQSPDDRYTFSCSKYKVREACYTSDFVGGRHSGLKTGLRCKGEINSI